MMIFIHHSTAVAKLKDKQNATTTRMVQLPATAAIEYVAACYRTRTRTRTRTKTKTRTKIGTITKTVGGPYARPPKFNAYTHRVGFLCLASYSVTDKHTKKRNSAP